MASLGHSALLTPDKCRKQWNDLKEKFKIKRAEKEKSGNSADKQEWQFYENMDELLRSDHTVNPPQPLSNSALPKVKFV